MDKIVINSLHSIGERRYFIESTGKEAFILRFGKPRQIAGGDFRCDFQFIGQCEDESIFAVFIDEIGAIDSAFWLAGSIVDRLSETKFGGELRWAGARPGKPIGLPVLPLIDVTEPDFRTY